MTMVLRVPVHALGKKVVMGVTGLIMIGFADPARGGQPAGLRGPEKLNAYSAILHGPLHEVTLLLRGSPAAFAGAARDRGGAAHPAGSGRTPGRVRPDGRRRRRRSPRGPCARRGAAARLHHLSPAALHHRQRPPRFHRGRRLPQPRHRLPASPVVAVLTSWRWPPLGLHLYHGGWAMFQSLGAAQPTPNPTATGRSPG